MRSRTEAAPSFVFADALAPEGAELVLSGEESHYLSRVVRAREGERVTATDGRGGLAHVRLTDVGRETRGRIERLEQRPRLRTLIVACGAPEGDRADWMVEKLAELGAARLQPLDCERGGWTRWEGRADRLMRLARAALRQSRSCHAIEIASPLPFERWLQSGPEGEKFLADPQGGRASAESPPVEGAATVAVGASGGFSEDEHNVMREMEFRLVRLAPTRLRTETAAVVAAAWWAAAAPGTPEAGERGPDGR